MSSSLPYLDPFKAACHATYRRVRIERSAIGDRKLTRLTPTASAGTSLQLRARSVGDTIARIGRFVINASSSHESTRRRSKALSAAVLRIRSAAASASTWLASAAAISLAYIRHCSTRAIDVTSWYGGDQTNASATQLDSCSVTWHPCTSYRFCSYPAFNVRQYIRRWKCLLRLAAEAAEAAAYFFRDDRSGDQANVTRSFERLAMDQWVALFDVNEVSGRGERGLHHPVIHWLGMSPPGVAAVRLFSLYRNIRSRISLL